MASEAKYHHLVPQTYMSAWANQSGTILCKDMTSGEIGEKNKEKICGINHYHSIIAGMPLCTEEDVQTIFAALNNYDVYYDGKQINDYLELNRLYYDFDNWEIKRKTDGSPVSKKVVRDAIDQVKIRDIETSWSTKYENKWPDIRSEIENKVLQESGAIPEFQKDFLMKFYVSMDWRSFALDPLFVDVFDKIGNSILEMDKIDIPSDERELPFFETMADYFRHCLLLKMYRQFLNEEGPIYTHAIESILHTSFHFLIADGQTKFYTSDNPSFTCLLEDGTKVGLMPVTPRILLAQGKKSDQASEYYITHITDEAVQTYNRYIEKNAEHYLIMDNSVCKIT